MTLERWQALVPDDVVQDVLQARAEAASLKLNRRPVRAATSPKPRAAWPRIVRTL